VLVFPTRIRDSVISRIKIIANMDITNRRFPQDGRSALRLKDKTVDLRISTLPRSTVKPLSSDSLTVNRTDCFKQARFIRENHETPY